jgi:hypothetical protein
VSAPLYTRAFFTACAIHFVGALSLAMWFLLPLYVHISAAAMRLIGLLPRRGDRGEVWHARSWARCSTLRPAPASWCSAASPKRDVDAVSVG